MSTLQYFGVPTGAGTGRGGMLMPKAKHKFRVFVTNFGVPTNSIALTQQVMTVGRPTPSMERVTVHSYMSQAYYAGKASFEPISLTCRDDVTNSLSTLVGAQLQKQMNFFLQTTVLSGDDYKFQMTIQTMDGSDDGVIEEWDLEGCFLVSANYESFDYSTAEAMTIEMSISFDNATQAGGLMPLNPIQSNGAGFIS